MNSRLIYLLAFVWGAVWASFLQFNRMGQFLAQKRTWLTVVIGVGLDLLLLFPLIPWRVWLQIFTVISLSSLAIIFRSLKNELGELLEAINGIKGN